MGQRSLPSWERLAAAVIDFLVLIVPQLILFTVIAGHRFSKIYSFEVAHRGEGAAKLAANSTFIRLGHQFTPAFDTFLIVSEALTAAYLIGMYLGTGATLGKLALGLRISRVDGRPMTVRDGVLRSLVFWVPFLIPLVGVWLLLLQYVGGTLVLLIRPDHRGPEDLVAGTFVMRKADQGRSLAEISGVGLQSISAPPPSDSPVVRTGHLPGWGPVTDQPPSPGEESEEAPN
ncbi:MAG: RDD family protein [Candidatus Dormibacteria bacterium]